MPPLGRLPLETSTKVTTPAGGWAIRLLLAMLAIVALSE